jgi:hypothetical protein
VFTNIRIEPINISIIIGSSISSSSIIELDIGIKTVDIVTVFSSERESKFLEWGSVLNCINGNLLVVSKSILDMSNYLLGSIRVTVVNMEPFSFE